MGTIRCMLVFLLALTLGAVAPQDAPDKALKSKDPLVRLEAIEALVSGDHEKREKLLIGALKDDDWEVAERAAEGLGSVGTADAVTPLVKLTLEAPVQRLRRRAAESLAKLDADKAYEGVAKKVASKQARAACEAMVILAPALSEEVSPKAAEKALKSKEGPVREAAASALVLLVREERAARLAELLEHDEVAVRCAAVEAAGASADASLGPVLLEALGTDPLPEVLERRAIQSLIQLLAGVAESEREGLAQACTGFAPQAPAAAARAARLLGRAAAAGALDRASALGALERLAGASDAGTRAAAVQGLGRVGSDGSLLLAADKAANDASARVRRAALGALPPDTEATQELAVQLLSDADPGVREDAAVVLGQKGAAASVSPLAKALADPEWTVAVCAAVSLGKTRQAEGLTPLVNLAGHEDWRRRGAAVVGLGHLYQKEAIPHVIAALEDADAVVRRTAWEYLASVAGRRIEPEVEPWNTWWADSEKRIVLVDPEEEAARREKYGYQRSATEIYAGLDVVVFESRGDHIQNILADLGIDHRMTTQGRVGEAEVHARSVFVSNCTGEMTGEDVARLAWFVRVGGYLFGSCWAVHETIARALPGVVGRLATRGEVLDNVRAAPCSADSPYLEGVFQADVTPFYALEGAYLIDVLDPERCEVLVDSPECHDRWGGGNLAVWFAAGHGVVLDSVNHFDEQGLARATWLKKPEHRMAYAVDHMGLSYADLREVRKAGFWKKSQEAAKEVKDLSVFRLITNFVRQKRIAGDG